MIRVDSLKPGDYDDILVGWWKDWRWTPPSRDFLPLNGEGGFMIYDDDIPVVAGFLYLTNSKVAWCEFVVSNINYKDKEKRKEAMVSLLYSLEILAKANGKKFLYSVMSNQSLINIYKECGYVESSSGFKEMIKIL